MVDIRGLRWVFTVTLLLLAAGAQPAASQTADGFIEANAPVDLEGDISGLSIDPSVHIQNPDLVAPDRPILLEASSVELTHWTRETSSADAGPNQLILPGGGNDRTDRSYENVTLELSAISQDADLLMAPSDTGSLVTSVSERSGQARVSLNTSGLKVLDGYQKTVGEREAGAQSNDFLWTYERDGPLTFLEGADTMDLSGDMIMYVWSAHVTVRNGTDQLGSFETGYEVRNGPSGSTETKTYRYVLMELSGVQASLAPGGLETRIYAPGQRLDVQGQALFSDAQGSFKAGDEIYRSASPRPLRLDGTLSLDITPVAGDSAELTIGLSGELSGTSLTPLDVNTGLVSPTMAATAGGATVLGLAAAWYIFGAKGASAALLMARPRDDEEDAVDAWTEPDIDPERPGDLLFDPDRFTLYHLIGSRAGLTAAEASKETGIEDAKEALELMADHGLLAPMSEDPRRYCMPGQIDERLAGQIAFLRETPAAHQVATLLAIHGLMPKVRLVERAKKAKHSVPAYKTEQVVQGLVQRGLAIEEPGEHGEVVDPSQALYDCLDHMGEPAFQSA